jgi:hypothetical protein
MSGSGGWSITSSQADNIVEALEEGEKMAMHQSSESSLVSQTAFKRKSMNEYECY